MFTCRIDEKWSYSFMILDTKSLPRQKFRGRLTVLYLLKKKKSPSHFIRNYVMPPLFANTGTLPILDFIIIIAQNYLPILYKVT